MSLKASKMICVNIYDGLEPFVSMKKMCCICTISLGVKKESRRGSGGAYSSSSICGVTAFDKLRNKRRGA